MNALAPNAEKRFVPACIYPVAAPVTKALFAVQLSPEVEPQTRTRSHGVFPMLVTTVTWALVALAVYSSLGVLFALPFVMHWVKRLDPDAAEGSWGFKVLIFPGSVALWPLLVRRVLAGQAGMPAERTPHRTAAGEQR